ncbi:unnamed protein product [Paramecium primaurelia]|uniref:PWWP domain-containing protein n=1 Tax=Paramecium primaurelia TaxID=5886 RepID=A0A8S1KG94_PARPR|nr:unnamed protein product [Paramecium primaurelia]
MDSEIPESYSKDEIVWAKIRGYPWWPGIIAEVIKDKQSSEPTKYLVNFIGDNSHSTLPFQSLAKYQEKYEEIVQKIKTKQHKDSVTAADQILKGQSTYEIESKKISKKKNFTKTVSKKKRTRSSSSEEHSGIYGSSRKSKMDSEDSTKPDNFSSEIQELLKLMTETKLNPLQIETKISSLIQIVDLDRPDIMEILQGPNGKLLMEIQARLTDKKNLSQAQVDFTQFLEKLKSIVLRTYFDPTEIIQQLHQVSGQKKITQKLLEKLQNQPNFILDSEDDSEDSDSGESDGESEEDESSEVSVKKGKYQRQIPITKPIIRKKITQNQSPKKLRKQSQDVPNPLQKNKVVQKISETISEYTDQIIPKRISEDIESRIRSCDSNMGFVYKKKYRTILENIKKSPKQELINFLQNSSNLEQLWNYLNGTTQSMNQSGNKQNDYEQQYS